MPIVSIYQCHQLFPIRAHYYKGGKLCWAKFKCGTSSYTKQRFGCQSSSWYKKFCRSLTGAFLGTSCSSNKPLGNMEMSLVGDVYRFCLVRKAILSCNSNSVVSFSCELFIEQSIVLDCETKKRFCVFTCVTSISTLSLSSSSLRGDPKESDPLKPECPNDDMEKQGQLLEPPRAVLIVRLGSCDADDALNETRNAQDSKIKLKLGPQGGYGVQ